MLLGVGVGVLQKSVLITLFQVFKSFQTCIYIFESISVCCGYIWIVVVIDFTCYLLIVEAIGMYIYCTLYYIMKHLFII